MAMRAATALIALLLSSSCFSYSCFTAFALTFVVTVVRNGSTSLSSFVSTAPGQSCNRAYWVSFLFEPEDIITIKYESSPFYKNLSYYVDMYSDCH